MEKMDTTELEKTAEALVEQLLTVVPYAFASQPGSLGDVPYICIWTSLEAKEKWLYGIYQNTKRVILFLHTVPAENTYRLEVTFQNVKKGKRKLNAKGSLEQLKEKMIKWFSSVKT